MNSIRKISKIIAIMLIAVMLAGNLTAFAQDREITASGVYGEVNWTLYSDGELVISGKGKTGSEWRNSISGKDVTKVTVEEGITFISGNAFNGYEMTDIILPSTLEQIYSTAFMNCTTLENVYFNGSVADWCSIAFGAASTYSYNNPLSYAENLYIDNILVKDLVIPEGVTVVSANAFRDYKILESVTFPEGFVSVGESAFLNCTSLSKVNFSESIRKINARAFSGCSALDEIKLPEKIEYIGSAAFKNTAYYNDNANWDSGFLYIGNNLIEAIEKNIDSDCRLFSKTRLIASDAFYNIPSLESITMPDCVEYINDGVFYNCGKMKLSGLPKNLKAIGKSAFMYCGQIDEIDVPSSVNSIGNSAFYGCNIEKLTLREGLCEIGSYVFANNSSLTEIYIPSTVTYLDESAFKTSSITDVCYGDTKAEWKRLASNVSLGDITVHYTLRNADDSVLIQHTDKNFIWEAGNVHLVVSEVTPATPSYDRNGYYIKNMINPVKVLDIKIVDGDGNTIQPLSDETITVKISAPDEFRDMVSAMLSADGEIDFETVEFCDGTFAYEKDGKTVKVTLSDAELNKLKIVHWFSDGTEPGDYEVFKSDRMEIRNGYIVLETNHFSEYAVCTEYVPEYTITFDTDGGTEIAPITLEVGAAITPPANPEKEGYTFVGWSPEIPETMPEENITVVAIYEKIDIPDDNDEPDAPTVTVTGIKVINLPNKIQYSYKDKSLDLSGIALKVMYSDGKSEIITDTEQIEVYGFDAKTVGTKTITVIYGDYTDEFEITVAYTWWQMIIRILLLGFFWY